MPIRCPVCKAENATTPCRRCKADLSPIFALETQRTTEFTAARRALVAGRHGEALAHARQADHLRRDDESQRLLAVAALLAGDPAEAWRCYRRVSG